MIQKSFLLLATASVLALAACAGDSVSPQTAPTSPVPAHDAIAAPGAVTMIPPTNGNPAALTSMPPATDLLNAPMSTMAKTPDVESRLTRLETDVEVIKGQVQLVRPLLEKMPALQDKLSELVAELQRIDARVAAAKSDTRDMPDVKSEPAHAMPAPFKPAPKMSPIISPAQKPTAPLSAHKKTSAVPPSLTPPKSGQVITPATTNAGAPPPSAPTPTTTMSTTSTSTTALPMITPTTQKGILAVRVGDDTEKTRIVIDIGAPTEFQYDLDNGEKILIIDLNTPVTSAMVGQFDKSPLVASYSTQAITPDKSRLILQLRTAIKVLKTSTLPPSDGKNDRIILDLVPAQL